MSVRLPRLFFLLLAIAPAAHAADQWTRLATPDFELYTNAGEKKGRAAIQLFKQVRGFFLRASPVKAPADFPVRIVAFKTKEDFQVYTSNPLALAYFRAGPRRDYIVMQDPSRESSPVAIHEYMHLIVRHSGLRIPLWLNEGWAEVYSTLRPVADGVAVGDLIPTRMAALVNVKLMDLDALNAVTVESPAYNEANRVGLFYAESWALAHMLFLSPEYRDNFGKFVLALSRGNSVAQACTAAFGRSSAQVLDDLSAYLERKKLFGAVFKTGLDKPAQPEVSTASEFDRRLVLADLLASLGRTEEARREYGELDAMKPGQVEVVRSLGFLALVSHDPAVARGYFEKAFAAGDTDARMCFALSGLERDAKQPWSVVRPPLECAVRSNPGYTEARIELGLLQIAARDFEGGIAGLMSIPNVTPDRAAPVFTALAYAYLETGDVDRARKNILNARKWGKTAAEAKILGGLQGLLDARSAGPFAAQPVEKRKRMQGIAQSVECDASGSRLRVLENTGPANDRPANDRPANDRPANDRPANIRTIRFALPPPAAIEFQHEGENRTLACGPLPPFPLTVEYVPTAATPEAPVAGFVRRIEF